MSAKANGPLLRAVGPMSTPGAQADALAPPSPIKVLKFVTLFGFGGTERHVVNLARGLDRSRFDVSLACLERWGHFLEEIEQQQIHVAEYKTNSLRSPTTLRQQLRLAGDLRRQQIQIVHSYNFYANVFAIPAAKLAGAPVIVASIRDMGIYLTPARKRVQKLVVRLADCVLVNAEAVKQWLIEEGYRADKISVIKNGVDLSKFVGRNKGTKLRQELGLPRQAPVVVMLSRLNPQKGIDYFLEAAAIVHGRCPKAHFLVVGENFILRDGVRERDVAYQQELEGRAARLGLGRCVVFTGYRDDVPELLSDAAVSVLPSLSEGLSNTLLESMAAGVPVVATKVGGNAEVIGDGKAGLLVPPRDSRALADAICAILESPELARSLGLEGRRRVAERFSLERMVGETQDLYSRLLEAKFKQSGSMGSRVVNLQSRR